jgi:hypothetical protein
MISAPCERIPPRSPRPAHCPQVVSAPSLAGHSPRRRHDLHALSTCSAAASAATGRIVVVPTLPAPGRITVVSPRAVIAAPSMAGDTCSAVASAATGRIAVVPTLPAPGRITVVSPRAVIAAPSTQVIGGCN